MTKDNVDAVTKELELIYQDAQVLAPINDPVARGIAIRTQNRLKRAMAALRPDLVEEAPKPPPAQPTGTTGQLSESTLSS